MYSIIKNRQSNKKQQHVVTMGVDQIYLSILIVSHSFIFLDSIGKRIAQAFKICQKNNSCILQY